MAKTQRRHDKTFWEMKARKYPLPFAPDNLAKTKAMIALAESHGVRPVGATILDLGCGTGTYTLPLAQAAERVTGVDSSTTMLERLRKEAKRAGISNVATIQATWQDAEILARHWEQAFDIVWAAMTPAVRDQKTLDRMIHCSRAWCVYIGWGRKRTNPLLEEAFRLHQTPFTPGHWLEKITVQLAASATPYTLDYVDTSWEWRGSLEEAVEDISGHIRMHQGTPDNQLICELLARHSDSNNTIHHTTSVEQGVLTWHI